MKSARLDRGADVAFLTMPTDRLVLFQALIESSENLAIVRTIHADCGLVALIFSQDQEKDLCSFLLSLEDRWQIRMLERSEASVMLSNAGLELTDEVILGTTGIPGDTA